MDEEWVPLEEFPEYAITNFGTVTNIATRRDIQQSTTMQGGVKVGLMKEGKQYTRSVKVLVAETFVPGKTSIFDTAVHRDGNQFNNSADNLIWRPRWFAIQYSRQFTEITKLDLRGPIIETNTRKEYRDIADAAMDNGVLFKAVFKAVYYDIPTFPTNQMFELKKGRRRAKQV